MNFQLSKFGATLLKIMLFLTIEMAHVAKIAIFMKKGAL
jgi:hypothetical protein